MSQDKRQMREIDGGESWLREVCHEPPPPNADRIKLRVRIAAHETWLEPQLTDGTPVGLADRVKESIRTVVIGQGGESVGAAAQGRLARRFRWWSVGVASAAAAVLLAFIGLQNRVTADMEAPLADAFVSIDNNDFEAALATLGADVADLELTLNNSSLAQADDWMYLNIGEDLDSAASEPFADDDWFGLDAFSGGSGT